MRNWREPIFWLLLFWQCQREHQKNTITLSEMVKVLLKDPYRNQFIIFRMWPHTDPTDFFEPVDLLLMRINIFMNILVASLESDMVNGLPSANNRNSKELNIALKGVPTEYTLDHLLNCPMNISKTGYENGRFNLMEKLQDIAIDKAERERKSDEEFHPDNDADYSDDAARSVQNKRKHRTRRHRESKQIKDLVRAATAALNLNKERGLTLDEVASIILDKQKVDVRQFGEQFVHALGCRNCSRGASEIYRGRCCHPPLTVGEFVVRTLLGREL